MGICRFASIDIAVTVHQALQVEIQATLYVWLSPFRYILEEVDPKYPSPKLINTKIDIVR